MNRIFKTIRNPITGIVTAASELAKGTSISSRNIGKRNFLALLTAALLSTCVFAETHEFEITDGSAGWSFKPIDKATNTPLVNDVKITIDIQADQDSPYFIFGSATDNSDAICFENNSITASIDNIDNIDGYSAPSILGVMKNYNGTESADFYFNNNTVMINKGAYESILTTGISTNDLDKALNAHTATFNNNQLYVGEDVRVNHATLVQAESIQDLVVTNNLLTVDGAEIRNVTGIYVDNTVNTALEGNHFNIANGADLKDFRGIQTRDVTTANIENNHYSIQDSAIGLFQGMDLYRGDNTTINNNQFTIKNSKIDLFQAISLHSNDLDSPEKTHVINGNTITIRNSDLKGFSGINTNAALNSQTISNNHFIIEDSTIRGQYVDAGWTIMEMSPAVAIRAISMPTLNISGNSIYVKNASLGFDAHENTNEKLPFNAIYARSAGATIHHNDININNDALTDITAIKFEGYPESKVADRDQQVDINHNTVMIDGGKGIATIIGIEEMHLPVAQWDDEAERFKSYAISSVSNNNTIILNNVDLDAQEIVGIKKTAMDHYYDQNNVNLTTNDNIVLISDSHISAEDGVTGISTIVEYQSWNESRPDLFSHLTLNAAYNTLSITDSEIEGDIRGTQLALGTSSPWGQPLMSGNKIDADNSHNTLNLTGGIFQGNIYGVYLTANNNRDVTEANIHATHNTVNLSGDLTLSKDHRMYGAYKDENLTTHGFSTLNYDLFTGNTLNFSANNALSLNEIGGFEFYNFILDPNIKDPYITANTINLESEDLIYQEGSIQSKNAAVNVTGIKGGRELQNGEEFILMSANQNLIGEHGATQTTTIKHGISLEYDVTTNVDTEGKQVIATIGKNPPLTPLEPSTPIIPLTPLEPATPIIPLTPLEPATPIIPLTPLEPATPIIPLTPLEPATPIIPLTPLEPATPIIPLTPLEPATPIIPLTPLEPATPIIPLTPLEPATPIIPLTPLEPATPIIPLTPLEPATPIIPLTPLEPATPIIPLTPLEPATPIIPLTPLEPATPIIPLIPLEPATPIIPLTPLEPATPIIPLTPLEPATPTTPLTPLEPATPTTPLTPLEPSTPTTPLTPLEPATPTTPLTPLEPATPTTPLTPLEPLEPATPTTPLTPLEPATPTTPLTPLEPATPTTPLTPLEPATPTTPLTPLEPATPTTPLTPLEPATPTTPLTPLAPATPTIPSGPRVNAQLKSLNEGFLAGAMLVNRTQDMITHQVLNEIESNDSQGFGTFGTIMGGYHRYNSGSHVKSKDFMMAVGLSYQVDALTLAAFAESSWSDYDTYNDFKDKASVHGDGDTRAYGLGLIAKYEWDNGVYIDGSMSMGKLRNTFETKDLQDAGTGEFARYTLKTNYRSAHIGIGYQFSLNELNRLDISGKYLWSHIHGQDITVANDPIHFDSMTSKRVRVNATLTHDYSKTIQLNAGIGYEYEFGGEATGITYGRYAIEAPSVKGSTGIISIGMSVKPEFNRRLEFNIKGEGSFGKRRGASLSIGGKYEF